MVLKSSMASGAHWSGFTCTAGHRSSARQALQSFGLLARATAVIADFGQKTRRNLRSGAR